MKSHDEFELRLGEISEDDERYRTFVGYDPEGYYLEFDTFLVHEDNARLLQALRRPGLPNDYPVQPDKNSAT